MSRIAKWKPDKTNVKLVFRLQFHATHIPQPGWDKLFVSFIPVDSGKATAKTTKANVKNGTCKWSDPVYETAKLLQDAKTKKFDEKLYKLVVEMGSTRSNMLGETTINLADYADASKPSAVAFPLEGCNSGTILHVTVQLLTSKTGFREFEKQRELRERGFHPVTEPSVRDGSTGKVIVSTKIATGQIEKSNARVKFRSDYTELLEEEREVNNVDYPDSAAGIDVSSNTSESLYAEKHDVSINYDVESLKSTISGDLVGFSLDQMPPVAKGNLCDPRTLAQGSHDWIHGWSSDYSVDNDVSTGYEENSRLHRSLEISEASIQDLKMELCSLQSHAEVIGVETQRFSHILASEIASGEKLSSEVSILKAECSKLKNELKDLNPSEELSYRTGKEGPHANENCLHANNLMREKVSSLICELEESKSEREDLVKKMNQMECYYEALLQEVEVSQKQMVDELQKLRNEHSTCLFKISSAEAQFERMHVEMNEQLLRFVEERQNLDFLNKELENRAVASEASLKKLRWNYSVVVDQLQKDLEVLSFQVLSMYETNENLARQAFAEASQYCLEENTEEDLQKDTTDEPLKAKTRGIRVTTDVRNSRKAASFNICGPLNASKGFLNAKLHSEDDAIKNLVDEESLSKKIERSVWLQEELLKKAESELSEMYAENVHLGVLSNVLQQSLYQASSEIILMKDKINNLTQLLEQSTECKELLNLKLQSSLDDIEILRASETRCLTKCNNLSSENHTLEAKLQTALIDNCLLAKKLADCEELVTEYKGQGSKYETERKEIQKGLEETNLEKLRLQSELDSMLKEMITLKEEFDRQTTSKDNAERSVICLEDKLSHLTSTMICYCNQINEPLRPQVEKVDSTTTILQLENLQKNLYEQLLQISKGKKEIEVEKDNTQKALENAESEILSLQQKFDSAMHDLGRKLEVADLEAEQHRLEFQALEDKLKATSEAGDRYTAKNKELELELIESETLLQYLTSENKDLRQKIHNSESIISELEKTKLSLLESQQSLEAGKDESVRLANELASLQASFKHARDKLQAEKDSRYLLETKTSELIFQLNDKQQCFNDQSAKLLHLSRQICDLESDNIRMKHLLSQNEELQMSQIKDASSFSMQIADLETCLSSVYENLLASDIELGFTKDHFSVKTQELNDQVESFKSCIEDLQIKHLDANNTLANCRISEALYIEEKTTLSDTLALLKTQLEKINSEKSELDKAIKTREAGLEVDDCSQEKHRQDVIEQLQSNLLQLDEELDCIRWSSRDELDIIVVVLKSKLDEQQIQISRMQEFHNNMEILQNEYNRLSQKLSEQILKTEEFKNLSIHLRELKNKAEAECLQAREKGDGGGSVAQESLRMAFIREQCESKVQELRSQLYASKRHGEEMLLKLQNAVDEIENRKKCEATLAKKNEDLSRKILKLEDDLQLALAEKRERGSSFDRMKAELECTMISLDCCKEEKLGLEASLQECDEEKTKIAIEFNILKGILESSASLAGSKEQKDNDPDQPQKPNDNSRLQLIQHKPKDVLTSKSGLQMSQDMLKEQDKSLENSMKQITQLNEKFRERSLKPSMDSIQRELERLRVENLNSLHPLDDHGIEIASLGLQKELTQLDMVNERLSNMFPLYNEYSGGGNALEKVLALEIELAEALESKKKSNVHFQSSFLKQHNDDEAVFQSFRDINELIKDMLELKRRYGTVESELKEMHNRYSDLSLHFAEVEGERQKLMMTLKNIRLPKRQ